MFRAGSQRAEARKLEQEPHPECAILSSSSSSYSPLAVPVPVSGRSEAVRWEGEPHLECVVPRSLSSPYTYPVRGMKGDEHLE